jgi:hypothetical protein
MPAQPPYLASGHVVGHWHGGRIFSEKTISCTDSPSCAQLCEVRAEPMGIEVVVGDLKDFKVPLLPHPRTGFPFLPPAGVDP